MMRIKKMEFWISSSSGDFCELGVGLGVVVVLKVPVARARNLYTCSRAKRRLLGHSLEGKNIYYNFVYRREYTSSPPVGRVLAFATAPARNKVYYAYP